MTPGEAVLVALVVAAPVSLVVIVAMLRGYDLTVVFRRRGRRDDDPP